MTLKTIVEAIEYIIHEHPKWLGESGEMSMWGRRLTREQPRRFTLHTRGAQMLVHIKQRFGKIYENSRVRDTDILLHDYLTREMVDEAIHWGETGKAPAWFPPDVALWPFDDAVEIYEKDVSQCQEELDTAQQRLDDANEARERFLANHVVDANKKADE